MVGPSVGWRGGGGGVRVLQNKFGTGAQHVMKKMDPYNDTYINTHTYMYTYNDTYGTYIHIISYVHMPWHMGELWGGGTSPLFHPL